MININSNSIYFHKVKDKIIEFYKNNKKSDIDNFKFLLDEEFHYNLNKIYYEFAKKINKRKAYLIKYPNIKVLVESKTILPSTSVLFLMRTLENFKRRLYYQSLISVPQFDGMLDSVCKILNISTKVIDECSVNGYVETRKSSHTFIALMKERDNVKINPLLDLIFSEDALNLRADYSHFGFSGDEHIKIVAYLYMLLLIDIFYVNSGILYL